MKKYTYLIFALIAFSLSSCSTFTNVIISGQPGTEIMDTDGEILGTVDSLGELNLSLPDYRRYDLLMARTPGSERKVPFALDFEHRNVGLASFGETICFALISGGLTTNIVGDIVFLSTGGGSGMLSMLGGLAIMVSSFLFEPAIERMYQDAYDYQYKYFLQQRTNNDINFTSPAFNIPKSETRLLTTRSGESTAKTETNTQRVNRTLRDDSFAVQGTYSGTGFLADGKVEIESYSEVIIIVKKCAKKRVTVTFMESGENYFAYDIDYNVTKTSNGDYSLTSDEYPNSFIIISDSGKMRYVNQSVIIDGVSYSLEANVSK